MTPESRPASPCQNVCVLDAQRTCVGCGRTLDEIARWGSMSAVEQWAVVARLERARAGESQEFSLQWPRHVAER
jgi:predicted Fe-S protein YdhL (DUF1289 family)